MTQPVTPPSDTQPQAGDPPAATTDTQTPPAQDQPPPAPGTTPGKDGDQLGPNGVKALQAEREARKELEKKLADLAPFADFVQQLRSGQAVPDSQKTDVEKLEARIAAAEQTASDEREARLRLEVATAKGLTSEQALRLQGKTREEFEADADALKALFPTAQPPSVEQLPGTPRPDPSQGQRGPVDLDALIADAEKSGNVRASIRLKQQKALQNRTQ